MAIVEIIRTILRILTNLFDFVEKPRDEGKGREKERERERSTMTWFIDKLALPSNFNLLR